MVVANPDRASGSIRDLEVVSFHSPRPSGPRSYSRSGIMLEMSDFGDNGVATEQGDVVVVQASPGDAVAILRLRDALASWMVERGIDQWRPGDMPLPWIEDGAGSSAERRLAGLDQRASGRGQHGALGVASGPALRPQGRRGAIAGLRSVPPSRFRSPLRSRFPSTYQAILGRIGRLFPHNRGRGRRD